MRSYRMAVALCAGLTLGLAPAEALAAWETPADERRPEQLVDAEITEHLGASVDLDLEFVDQGGQTVRLRDYFSADRPVLLTLNYYECPSICTVQLNGLLDGLRNIDLDDDEFRVVTVSIDPDEGPSLAAAKRDAYRQVLGRDGLAWDFLVGDSGPIKQLADAVGFGFQYDAASDNYAHRPAIFLISPEGVITRYLYGIEYDSRDLKFALIEASEGTVGSTIDRILLTCFHYIDGTYAPFAFGIMRLGGIVVASALGVLLLILWRREYSRRRPAEATS